MSSWITLDKKTIETEHICCAISDKKCTEGYQAKKDWLKTQFGHGYKFRRLDERGKVFIEYGPAEKAWLPIIAPNYLNINCFWVSGRYKKQGYGKTLLESAMEDVDKLGKSGLVTVVGTKKFHFMSDTRWFLRQGFEECDRTNSGFSLLVKKTNDTAQDPTFNSSVREGKCAEKKGLVVYYSNRCPFAEFHAKNSLVATAKARGLPLKIIKLSTMEAAQKAPSPATIFSLFIDGEFVTTDIGACLESRFDKLMSKR